MAEVAMARRCLAIPLLALLLQSAAGCSHAATSGGAAPPTTGAAPGGGGAARTPETVPAPRALGVCGPDGAATSGMERMVSMLRGRSLGCFQSSGTTELLGLKKAHAVPLEFAFAVEMPGGPYSAQDVDQLMSGVTEQWKSSKPLNQETRGDYDRRLDDLVEKGAPRGTPEAQPLKPATLVSIEKLDPASFAVVSIRQLQVSLDGEFFNATRVDAAAVVLEHSALVRLSITRELRSRPDVEAVREEIADWAYAVVSAP